MLVLAMDGFGRHYQETGGVRIWLLREKMMIDDQQQHHVLFFWLVLRQGRKGKFSFAPLSSCPLKAEK
jgi:hypothetical protein